MKLPNMKKSKTSQEGGERGGEEEGPSVEEATAKEEGGKEGWWEGKAEAKTETEGGRNNIKHSWYNGSKRGEQVLFAQQCLVENRISDRCDGQVKPVVTSRQLHKFDN